jgi:hypothetical protein
MEDEDWAAAGYEISNHIRRFPDSFVPQMLGVNRLNQVTSFTEAMDVDAILDDSSDSVTPVEVKDEAGNREKEWVVEKILSYQRHNNSKEKMYHVKWKGWSSEYNTWEPAENLTHCELVIQEFHARKQIRKEAAARKRKNSTL